MGEDRFKLLGITFDSDLDKMLTLHFTDKISNIKTKNNISLPNPNEKLLKDQNELFFNFIWTDTSRIKKTVLCRECCNGGFKRST